MLEEKQETVVEEELDPVVAAALAKLNFCTGQNVSVKVTESSSVEEENPDPYAEASGEVQLVYQRKPKAKRIIIAGKSWIDVTDIVGNFEEIAAMNTEVIGKKKLRVIKPADDGVLRREDQLIK